MSDIDTEFFLLCAMITDVEYIMAWCRWYIRVQSKHGRFISEYEYQEKTGWIFNWDELKMIRTKEIGDENNPWNIYHFWNIDYEGLTDTENGEE
jgi:hypothetical protein